MDKLEYDKGFGERLETQKRENEIIHKGVLEYKIEMHEKQKEFEDKAKVNKNKRNPFERKINEQSLANATKVKEKKAAMAANSGYDFYGQDMGMTNNDRVGMLDDDFGGAGMDIEDKLKAE
jgi:2-keto-4-pentenoate hydratase